MALTGKFALLGVLVGLSVAVRGSVLPRADDPCAAIGGQKWVAPKAVRDCYNAVPVNETLKQNVRPTSAMAVVHILIYACIL
jgi:hypothetical protein